MEVGLRAEVQVPGLRRKATAGSDYHGNGTASDPFIKWATASLK
jgi:hypothetical protein